MTDAPKIIIFVSGDVVGREKKTNDDETARDPAEADNIQGDVAPVFSANREGGVIISSTGGSVTISGDVVGRDKKTR